MNTKLTAAHLCLYPNARVKTDNYTCRVIGISFESNEVVLRATGGVVSDAFIHAISDCQLVLKPLERITDDDLISVGKIILPKCEHERMQKDMAWGFISKGKISIKMGDELRRLGYCTELNAFIEGWTVEEREV